MNDGELAEPAVILEGGMGDEADAGVDAIGSRAGGRTRMARGTAGLARGSMVDLRAALDGVRASDVVASGADLSLDSDTGDALDGGVLVVGDRSEVDADALDATLDSDALDADALDADALDADALDADALDADAASRGLVGAPGVSRKVRKRTKRDRPRSKTIAMKRVTRAELQLGALMYPHVEGFERPRTRAECSQEARPCPWVSCKHHLYLDINPETGSIKINFPDLEPWEMKHTCSLDVADAGALTLEEIGLITNLTRERIRQVEVRGLLKLKGRREIR